MVLNLHWLWLAYSRTAQSYYQKMAKRLPVNWKDLLPRHNPWDDKVPLMESDLGPRLEWRATCIQIAAGDEWVSYQEGRRMRGGAEIWLLSWCKQDAQAQTSGSPNPFILPSVAQSYLGVCVCSCFSLISGTAVVLAPLLMGLLVPMWQNVIPCMSCGYDLRLGSGCVCVCVHMPCCVCVDIFWF